MILDSERILELIKGIALPTNDNERYFLEGYNHGFSGTLLKDIIIENIEVNKMDYSEFMNYIIGYSFGQAYNMDDEFEDYDKPTNTKH